MNSKQGTRYIKNRLGNDLKKKFYNTMELYLKMELKRKLLLIVQDVNLLIMLLKISIVQNVVIL